MKIEITGTIQELVQIFPPTDVANLLGIDYYKIGQVPYADVFTITEADYVRCGMLEPQYAQGVHRVD